MDYILVLWMQGFNKGGVTTERFSSKHDCHAVGLTASKLQKSYYKCVRVQRLKFDK